MGRLFAGNLFGISVSVRASRPVFANYYYPQRQEGRYWQEDDSLGWNPQTSFGAVNLEWVRGQVRVEVLSHTRLARLREGLGLSPRLIRQNLVDGAPA